MLAAFTPNPKPFSLLFQYILEVMVDYFITLHKTLDLVPLSPQLFPIP